MAGMGVVLFPPAVVGGDPFPHTKRGLSSSCRQDLRKKRIADYPPLPRLKFGAVLLICLPRPLLSGKKKREEFWATPRCLWGFIFQPQKKRGNPACCPKACKLLALGRGGGRAADALLAARDEHRRRHRAIWEEKIDHDPLFEEEKKAAGLLPDGPATQNSRLSRKEKKCQSTLP